MNVVIGIQGNLVIPNANRRMIPGTVSTKNIPGYDFPEVLVIILQNGLYITF